MATHASQLQVVGHGEGRRVAVAARQLLGDQRAQVFEWQGLLHGLDVRVARDLGAKGLEVGGDEDRWYRETALAQLTQQFDARPLRHIDVGHHQVGALGVDPAKRLVE